AEPVAAPPPRSAGARPRATPVARNLAGRLGVSLAALEGSGPGGRIVRADVRRAAGPVGTDVLDRGRRAERIALTPTQRTSAERARARTLTADELSNGTFTISNLGMLGVRRFNAVINHPQAAILAVGAVAERPVVTAGQLRVGTTMELTLSCDHRIVYGADAA